MSFLDGIDIQSCILCRIIAEVWKMNRRDFLGGRWVPYLERALTMKPCFNGSFNGGKVQMFEGRLGINTSLV